MKKTLPLLAAILPFAVPSPAAPTVSGDGACGIRALENESFLTCEGDFAPAPAEQQDDLAGALPSAFEITARRAVQMKADLGPRVMLADVRDHPPGAAMLERLDANMAATGLRHGDPVIVLARTDEQGRLAAEFMREHGYLQVFVIQERGGWRLAAGRDGR